jgi:iron complex transport system substrate-binding protein
MRSRLTLTVIMIVALAVPVLAQNGPQHATGFTWKSIGESTLLTVTRPWQGATANDALHYLLYPRGTTPPGGYDDALAVAVPIESIVTMSTTLLPHLEKLDELGTLVGIDSLAYVYSQQVRELGASGDVAEVGSGSTVDVERVLTLDPDIALVNSYGGEWDADPYLIRAGVPTVVAGDWVEETPLGRAEWILFTALFYDKLDEGRELFRAIEAEYTALAAQAREQSAKPTVLINAPYQGTWYVSGGQSYAAAFIRDAGGEYVWSDDPTTGALYLDFETVFAEAADADIWINPGTWSSLADGRAEDERFTRFEAFAAGRVYNNNARVAEGGGIDYFESGAANPHVVLKDLIWAFHPELVPDYTPYYYHRLR